MNPTVFQCVQIAFTLALAFLSGLSSCFTLWAIPLLQLPRVPPHAKAVEFVHIFTLGGRYLQPTSRLLGASTVMLTAWSYAQDNGLWRYYLLCFGLLAPIAPWEMYMIFPINDRVAEMDRRMEQDGSNVLSAAEKNELGGLLSRWAKVHSFRFVMPALAAVVSAVAL
ncbi:hypothetical protein LTR56_000773 [Elasticomyces elasticus]|nr:hypothetical protein LTR22_009071 [Elasticomyces elasticus]KAK3660397.1 hypothetical protein LTR56_000773 [Elasticomyces elasticus]KAK4929212.1 hypothetical protein LTR49_004109 [Elasticomyces elasticus]KAK5765768.1 hypothetical protein LTS12_004028 [Elasticomyces elasticus]